MGGEVICSVLERTPEGLERALREVPRGCGLVEIRGDHLEAQDLAGLVRRAGRPVIATVRRTEDGGAFAGSEEERRRRLLAALEAGAAWVDVEWNRGLKDLASGSRASRVILSHHGAACDLHTLRPLYQAMAATPAARLKLVPRAETVAQTLALRDLLRETSGRRLAAFALGAAGVPSRVLCLLWGSWGTYGALAPGLETGPGQLTAQDLLEVYRAPELTPRTRLFALVGDPVTSSPSPAMHGAAYRTLGLDAVYLPCPASRIEEVEAIVLNLPLNGLAVTVPLKEAVAAKADAGDATAACGALNTVRIAPDGTWLGWNTDAVAVEALVRAHTEPAGKTCAVVGAGGMARAAAWALERAGARVTVYNRSPERAARLARDLGVAAQPLDALPSAAWEILVQATPLGRHGERVLPAGALRGQLVVEAVYGPEPTPLVRKARERGLKVVDGFELLVAQAERQFERLTGLEPPAGSMREAGEAWLARRRLAFRAPGP